MDVNKINDEKLFDRLSITAFKRIDWLRGAAMQVGEVDSSQISTNKSKRAWDNLKKKQLHLVRYVYMIEKERRKYRKMYKALKRLEYNKEVLTAYENPTKSKENG